MKRLLIALLILVGACGDSGIQTSIGPPTMPVGSPSDVTTLPTPTNPTPTGPTVAESPGGTAPPTSASAALPPATAPIETIQLARELVANGFRQPVFLTAPPGHPEVYVVDQPGTVFGLRGGDRWVYLDLTDRVRFEGERGMLGLAFHPGFDSNGRLFVSYTDLSGVSFVSEFTRSSATAADPSSERVLLQVAQPASNHNGGMIAFGPDGYLYVSLGDGGGANDQFGHGQRSDTLLGTILRIDVDGDPYAIPPDNPFVAGGGAPEVFVYGLRNPWRFTFDGDRLFIGDVGQRRWEEIDVITLDGGGANFGWSVMEASECFSVSGCDMSGLEMPVVEYFHDAGNCSVTGGHVYRGSAIPGLVGSYFYGDYCSGMVHSFRYDGALRDERDWSDTLRTPQLTSFGTDGQGELYLVSAEGSIWRIVES